MKIIASTQNPTLTQLTVANVLGVMANKVVVSVKRMGGGFGGKESRSVPITAVVAVAAVKTGQRYLTKDRILWMSLNMCYIPF